MVKLSFQALCLALAALFMVPFSNAATAQVLGGDPLWTRSISGGFGPTRAMDLAVNTGPGTVVIGEYYSDTPGFGSGSRGQDLLFSGQSHVVLARLGDRGQPIWTRVFSSPAFPKRGQLNRFEVIKAQGQLDSGDFIVLLGALGVVVSPDGNVIRQQALPLPPFIRTVFFRGDGSFVGLSQTRRYNFGPDWTLTSESALPFPYRDLNGATLLDDGSVIAFLQTGQPIHPGSLVRLSATGTVLWQMAPGSEFDPSYLGTDKFFASTQLDVRVFSVQTGVELTRFAGCRGFPTPLRTLLMSCVANGSAEIRELDSALAEVGRWTIPEATGSLITLTAPNATDRFFSVTDGFKVNAYRLGPNGSSVRLLKDFQVSNSFDLRSLSSVGSISLIGLRTSAGSDYQTLAVSANGEQLATNNPVLIQTPFPLTAMTTSLTGRLAAVGASRPLDRLGFKTWFLEPDGSAQLTPLIQSPLISRTDDGRTLVAIPTRVSLLDPAFVPVLTVTGLASGVATMFGGFRFAPGNKVLAAFDTHSTLQGDLVSQISFGLDLTRGGLQPLPSIPPLTPLYQTFGKTLDSWQPLSATVFGHRKQLSSLSSTTIGARIFDLSSGVSTEIDIPFQCQFDQLSGVPTSAMYGAGKRCFARLDAGNTWVFTLPPAPPGSVQSNPVGDISGKISRTANNGAIWITNTKEGVSMRLFSPTGAVAGALDVPGATLSLDPMLETGPGRRLVAYHFPDGNFTKIRLIELDDTLSVVSSRLIAPVSGDASYARLLQAGSDGYYLGYRLMNFGAPERAVVQKYRLPSTAPALVLRPTGSTILPSGQALSLQAEALRFPASGSITVRTGPNSCEVAGPLGTCAVTDTTAGPAIAFATTGTGAGTVRSNDVPVIFTGSASIGVKLLAPPGGINTQASSSSYALQVFNAGPRRARGVFVSHRIKAGGTYACVASATSNCGSQHPGTSNIDREIALGVPDGVRFNVTWNGPFSEAVPIFLQAAIEVPDGVVDNDRADNQASIKIVPGVFAADFESSAVFLETCNGWCPATASQTPVQAQQFAKSRVSLQTFRPSGAQQ